MEQARFMLRQHIQEEHPDIGMMKSLIEKMDRMMPLLENLADNRTPDTTH